MQIGGEATWRRGLCCFFFLNFSLFAYITGSKIKKHVGGSTRGVYDPLAGVTTLTLQVRVVTPAIGPYTPPHTSPCVFLILLRVICLKSIGLLRFESIFCRIRLGSAARPRVSVLVYSAYSKALVKFQSNRCRRRALLSIRP